MTRVLAIDTSTGWGSVAILETAGAAPRLVAEAGLLMDDAMAAKLLPLADLLLQAAGWPLASIDLYAGARGPGSFTGIRVGLGLLAGWTLASNRPGVGVGTLHAIAEAYGPADADRIAVMSAGRGNGYRARFDAASFPPRPLSEPWAGPLAQALEGEAPGLVLAPAGLLDPALAVPGLRIATSSPSIAAAVGRIAAHRFAEGLGPADAPTPAYVSPSYVETGPR